MSGTLPLVEASAPAERREAASAVGSGWPIGGLALLGVLVLSASAVLPRIRPDRPWGFWHIAPHVVIGGVWIGAGLVALWRRPENRVGLLMCASGFLWFSDDIYWWGTPLSLSVSALLENLGLAVAAHLFLAYPSGRLGSRLERVIVAAAYVDAVVLAFVRLLFWDSTRDAGCPGCPHNVFLVDRNAAALHGVRNVIDVVAVVVGVAVVVVLARRWRLASAPARRVLAPVLWAGGLVAALTAATVLWEDLTGTDVPGYGGLSRPVDIAYALVAVAFLVGLGRMRLHRSVIASLVVELQSRSQPHEIRDALARALGDPSLELAFWLPDTGRYVDADGRPCHPEEAQGRDLHRLESGRAPLAILSLDPAVLEERDLVDAAAAAARLAIENSRLQADLRAQLEEVRASRTRIVGASDAERRRIERDLHDGAQQRLLGARLVLKLAKSRSGDTEALASLLNEADTEVRDALADIRTLARGIHPSILADEGLEPALAALARRAPLPVELTVTTGARLPQPVETAVYFLASEALTNVTKHAHASRVTISVSRTDGNVAVEIDDDGVGGADRAGGTGLGGLRDRIETLGGELSVRSPAGDGTGIRAVIPCA
jgi:signal transduction histidine kinase